MTVAIEFDGCIVHVQKLEGAGVQRPLGKGTAVEQHFEFIRVLPCCGLEAENFGDILDAEEDSFRLAWNSQSTSIQQHGPAANAFKLVGDLEIIKETLAWQYFFQELPQFGNVPLIIAQLEDHTARRFFRANIKRLVEGVVRNVQSQVRVENEQRIPYGANNGFREIPCTCNGLFRPFKVTDVHQYEHRTVDLIVDCEVRAHAQRIPATLYVPHLPLSFLHAGDH